LNRLGGKERRGEELNLVDGTIATMMKKLSGNFLYFSFLKIM
jgi:hypothetical protein